MFSLVDANDWFIAKLVIEISIYVNTVSFFLSTLHFFNCWFIISLS